jgi:hypothetical protein
MLRSTAKNRLFFDDDATGQARTRIPGWLSFEVVGTGMNDDAAPDDIALLLAVADLEFIDIGDQPGHAFGIGNQLWHIARVMFGMIWIAMQFARRIEMPSRTAAVRSAAITFFVDMKAVRPGCKTSDLGNNTQFLAGFTKNHAASYDVTSHWIDFRFSAIYPGRDYSTPAGSKHQRAGNAA